MRSKYEVYNIFKFGLKAYLPRYDCCPMLYLKELLLDEKKMIYKKELAIVDVPRWKEFNVEKMYEYAYA